MSIIEPLVIVLLICAIIAVMAARRPILFRMGVRNLTRRRAQTVIVILGLLVGTAIISSSLVIGDSLEYIFVKDSIERLDAVDELVYLKGPNEVGYNSFDFQMYTELKDALETNDTQIDGIAPLFTKMVSVQNLDEDLGEGSVSLVGFNASYEDGFGTFKDVDGREVDSHLIGNEIIINARAAEKLDAKVGQNLSINIGVYFPVTHNVTVKHIVGNEGKANWQKDSNIFIGLDRAQQMFMEPGKVNLIKISNTGGIEEGVDLSAEVTADVQSVIDTNVWSLEVEEKKKNDIENAKEFSENVTEIFMVLGSFSIIAGILLIVNIFVMLAEERKSEMGISRAVGMKRGHLMQTYMFEGLFYAIFAAILGTLFGLVLGYTIVWSFGIIFAEFAEGITLSFSYKPLSLALAFCLGLIITFVTIAVASWNISKLNIVRAIKKIPEPVSERATRKIMLMGALMIALGFVLTIQGILEGTNINTGTIAGPAIIILGASFVLYRVAKARTVFSLGGVGIIISVLFPRGTAEGNPSDIQMFIVIGVLLVLGAILIVMFNSDYILKPLFYVGSGKKGKPVLKIATSYPMRKKFRTGMTLAIFALTIFTVTVISMMSHLQEGSVIEEMGRQTGGFDIIGMAVNLPPNNFTQKFEQSQTLNEEDFEFYSWSATVPVRVNTSERDSELNYMLWGLSDDMIDYNKYTFQERADSYVDSQGAVRAIVTDRDVWEALKDNSSLAVVDGSAKMVYTYEAFGPRLKAEIGDVIEVNDTYNKANLTVIGIMDQVMFYTWGIFAGEDLLENELRGSYNKTYVYFFELKEGVDGFSISQDIEREFSWKIDTVYLPDLVRTILDIQRSVMLLLQAYLGLGLFVGIAALGVITVRSVVERKQEIGTLRAIGFKSRMISKVFLVEISFVALLGIMIGVFLGLALSYDMYLTYYADRVSFSIPWLNILIIALIAYIATLLATSSPARRAAKIPPAEAIRYIE